jgi:hypothetical protein
MTADLFPGERYFRRGDAECATPADHGHFHLAFEEAGFAD